MRLFVHLCSSWQYFNWRRASRGPSATAELLFIKSAARTAFTDSGRTSCRNQTLFSVLFRQFSVDTEEQGGAVAQRVERWTCDQQVVGSNPA